MIYKIVFTGVSFSNSYFSEATASAGEPVQMKNSGFSITVNGKSVRVAEGTHVAAAVMMTNDPTRFSVQGNARTPFCGMGICMECRATVNGVHQMRTCQLVCAPGLEVVTG